MSARAGALPALSLWVLVIALNETMVAPYQLDWYGLTHPVYRSAKASPKLSTRSSWSS